MVHERLIADINRISMRAGISAHRHLIWTPLAANCTKREVRWMKAFHDHSVNDWMGLLYAGHYDPPVGKRFRAMVACLLRNFVDAQIMMVGEIVDRIQEGDALMCSALFIPNLFFPKNEGGWILPAQVQSLHDLLLRRQYAGKQTVVYVSGLMDLEKEWGIHFKRILSEDAGYARITE